MNKYNVGKICYAWELWDWGFRVVKWYIRDIELDDYDVELDISEWNNTKNLEVKYRLTYKDTDGEYTTSRLVEEDRLHSTLAECEESIREFVAYEYKNFIKYTD